jgi:AcrR family transcriptional regulator
MAGERQDIKTNILNASEVLFAEKGFDGVSIEEIAKKADVNKAMIYYYFSSKEGLFISILQKHISKVETLLSSIDIRPSNNYRDVLHDMLVIAIDYIDSNSNIIKILLSETLLDTHKTKMDIINFINPIWDKMESVMRESSFEFGDMSIIDKMMCISLIINFVTIKERIAVSEVSDFIDIKNDFIGRLTDIFMLMTSKM